MFYIKWGRPFLLLLIFIAKLLLWCTSFDKHFTTSAKVCLVFCFCLFSVCFLGALLLFGFCLFAILEKSLSFNSLFLELIHLLEDCWLAKYEVLATLSSPSLPAKHCPVISSIIWKEQQYSLLVFYCWEWQIWNWSHIFWLSPKYLFYTLLVYKILSFVPELQSVLLCWLLCFRYSRRHTFSACSFTDFMSEKFPPPIFKHVFQFLCGLYNEFLCPVFMYSP